MQMKFAELRQENLFLRPVASGTWPQLRDPEFEFQLYSVRQSSFECDANVWPTRRVDAMAIKEHN